MLRTVEKATCLIERSLNLVILQSFLHERDEGMGLNMSCKRQCLGMLATPVTLEFCSCLAMAFGLSVIGCFARFRIESLA